LKKYFKKCFISFNPRKNFNEEFGKEKYLNSLNRELTIEDINNKYVCMASLSGLMHYIENISNLNLDRNALIIKYYYLENHLNIPYHSTIELELLNNRKFNTLEESLISLFDTKTASGARLLRSNFLQPLAIKKEICLRQNSVEELYNNKETLFCLRENLKNFKDLENYISKFSQKINFPTENTIRQILFAINGLKESFKNLKPLSDIIRKKLQSENFVKILKCFDDSALENILIRIDDLLDDIDLSSLKIGKKQDLILFMIKPNIDNVLDVSRKVYSDTIEEIQAEFERIKASTNDPHIKLLFNEAKGYYLSINENFYNEKEYVVAKKEGKKYNCANTFLLSFSQRIKEIKKDIIEISFKMVTEIYEFIQKNLSYVHLVSSYIALIDVLCSFAFYAINTKTICKPILLDNYISSSTQGQNEEKIYNNSSIINLENLDKDSSFSNKSIYENKNCQSDLMKKQFASPKSKSFLIGRKCYHPVLEKGNIIFSTYNTNENLNDYKICNKRKNINNEEAKPKFIPNDYYITELFNFLVIRGANASGKTTYMKQLALLIILSQCGCFVPCEYFKFSIRKYLFTKFDCSDSIEDNKGSFIKTILEIQKTISNNISYPLILLDEPFDNSETIENFCITLSIIERINQIKNTPLVILSSHNSNLNLLSSMFFNIIIGNMEVEFKQDSLNFLYKFEFLNPMEDVKKNKKNYDVLKDSNLTNNDSYPQYNLSFQDETEKNMKMFDENIENRCFNTENYGIVLANMLGFPKEMINVK